MADYLEKFLCFRQLFLLLSAIEKFWLELVFVGQELFLVCNVAILDANCILFVLSTATYLLVQLVRIQAFLLSMGSCPYIDKSGYVCCTLASQLAGSSELAGIVSTVTTRNPEVQPTCNKLLQCATVASPTCQQISRLQIASYKFRLKALLESVVTLHCDCKLFIVSTARALVRGIPLTEHAHSVQNLIMAERSYIWGGSRVRTRAVSKRSQNREKCFWPR